MQSNQVKLDEALVAFLQKEEEEARTIADEAIARELQNMKELTISDDVIAREIQREEEVRVQSYLHDDAKLAKTLQDLEGNLQPSLSDDEKLAKTLQDLEGKLQPSLSDDEKLARYLQQQDESPDRTDEYLQETKSYQTMQGNSSYIPHRDAPSTSSGIYNYNDGDNFSGYNTHPHSPSYISHDPPADENIDPTNMTYAEINELEDSIGHVSRGLSERKISRLKTHEYGTKPKTWWWQKKNEFVADDSQCSICLLDYAKGDKIITLPCKHIYHKDCITDWLKENKICCVCQAYI